MATKNEVLSAALESRKDEVLGYEINIENYERALAKIEAMEPSDRAELTEFENKLRALLVSERREHRKAKLMHDVLNDQVPPA